MVDFIGSYMSMPDQLKVVVAAWVMASWLHDVWDRFPHLGVTSPQKRCGKTRFLQLLKLICKDGCHTPNGSPAAIYRLIEQEKPTFLLDEAQSISRRGSESSEVIRELFNAGIDRDACVIRCAGNDHEVKKFSIYCPKVFALIGEVDGVLADRSLPIRLERKTADEVVKPYRSRLVEPDGKKLHDAIQEWSDENREKVAGVFDQLEPFEIENDRLAELLLSLQAVLTVDGQDDALDELEQYAKSLDAIADEKLPPDLVLLSACREIIGSTKFIATKDLIVALCKRKEEPWSEFNNGSPISPEKLRNLLTIYGIKPGLDTSRKFRGYARSSFRDAWERYLPKNPSNLSDPSEGPR